MTPPIVLRHKLLERILSVFGTLCVASMFIWILLAQSEVSTWERVFSLTVSASFVVLGFAWVLQTLVSITFDGALLTSEMPFRAAISVELTRAVAVRHNFFAQTLALLDAQGDTLLKINESLPRFSEFFEILRTARPDLWQIPTGSQFRIKRTFLLLFFTPILLLIPSMAGVALKGKLTMGMGVLGVISILALLNILRMQVVGLDVVPDGLQLHFPFRASRLAFSEIIKIKLTVPGENLAAHYFLRIQSGEKKDFVIRAFQVHEVLLFDKLSLLVPDRAIRASKLDNQTALRGS